MAKLSSDVEKRVKNVEVEKIFTFNEELPVAWNAIINSEKKVFLSL